MPTYLYECRDCHRRFEANKPIAERQTSSCPDCNGDGEKKVTASPWHFAHDSWADSHEQRGTPLRDKAR
jgi:putative FmdB family regulatory protein